MDEKTLRRLLDDVRTGEVAADDAVRILKRVPFADIGFAKIDHHRPLRQSLPEAVYAPGKTVEQCSAIVGELLEHGTGPVILSRSNEDQALRCLDDHPNGLREDSMLVWRPANERPGNLAVITAGTADLPVATECITTLEAQGFRPRLLPDIGVAGIHRALAALDEIGTLDAIVVVAGMEGALASFLGGVVGVPIVAVPTSVGYGAGLQGVTALLAMLASCASGITVVGIDNGFGAACAIARLMNSR